MATKLTMPQLGESVVEGTIGKWLVKEGERVEKDQPVVEILTDKADTEVPSPIAGVVTKLHAAIDDVIEVGGVLCEIDENATATASADAPASVAASQTADAEPLSSPSVRKLAREQNVNLAQIKGTGDAGRITPEDVMLAATRREETKEVQTPTSAGVPAPRIATPPAAPRKASGGAFRVPPYKPREGDKVVPFTRRRRIIADHMVYSKQTSPEVVTFAECDIQQTALLRAANKAAYKKDGLGLTYLAFVLHATARALREYPQLNARVLDDAYVLLGDINLGIAVDTDKGLVVPVIRNADDLSIRGLVRAITDIAQRARTGDLTPDDLANKTFSVSNPGRKGNLVGGAIISQPNVGILRLGTIKKRPVVITRDSEDFIAIHPVMYMALTYDHRVVDGVDANAFLYRVNEILEQGDFEV